MAGGVDGADVEGMGAVGEVAGLVAAAAGVPVAVVLAALEGRGVIVGRDAESELSLGLPDARCGRVGLRGAVLDDRLDGRRGIAVTGGVDGPRPDRVPPVGDRGDPRAVGVRPIVE